MLEPLLMFTLVLSPQAPAEAPPSPPPAEASDVGVDPNYSRLLFSPTGRPLKKGDGYFSDYELVFPGLAVGITDNVSIAGGVSVIPGVGVSDQLLYVSPKVGFELSDKAAVSVGGLYAWVPADDDVDDIAVAFAMGTFGSRRRSFTVGLGLADTYLPDGFNPTAILMVGSTATMSKHTAFVSEVWMKLEGFDLAESPFGLGVRFFGDRLSADVGLIIVPEYAGDGGFLPWASISFHFGPSSAARQRRSR